MPELRLGLRDLGFAVLQEEAVEDGGKVYSAFSAQYQEAPVETGPLYPYLGNLRPGAPQVEAYAQKALRVLTAQQKGALHTGDEGPGSLPRRADPANTRNVPAPHMRGAPWDERVRS